MDCKDVFVSSVNGADTSSCGSDETNFCKTIEYAYETRAVSDDVIIIDGGQNEPISYAINNINFTKACQFRKYEGSLYKPELHPNSEDDKYAFFVHGQSNVSISIDSIDFVEIGVLIFEHGSAFIPTGEIELNNSTKAR